MRARSVSRAIAPAALTCRPRSPTSPSARSTVAAEPVVSAPSSAFSAPSPSARATVAAEPVVVVVVVVVVAPASCRPAWSRRPPTLPSTARLHASRSRRLRTAPWRTSASAERAAVAGLLGAVAVAAAAATAAAAAGCSAAVAVAVAAVVAAVAVAGVK